LLCEGRELNHQPVLRHGPSRARVVCRRGSLTEPIRGSRVIKSAALSSAFPESDISGMQFAVLC
jgi:hypothetical protein